MSNMKKLVLLWIVISALLLLSSCSANNDLPLAEKKKVITVVLKMNNGEYWNTVKLGAEVAAKEFNVNLSFKSPADEDDVKGQIALVEQMLEDGTDGLVLAASDYMGLAKVTDQVGSQHIPVISIDSEVGSTKVRSFIGANNYNAGRTAGAKLIELTGQTGSIGVISFVQGARNADQREEGLLDYIAQFPGIVVADKQYSFSNEQLARELTRKMLLAHPDLKGIVALNAIASMGVASEIEEMGLTGKVKVIAFDSTPEVLEQLQEGIVQATIIQNPYSMGYLGVKYMVEALNGNVIPERVDTGSKVIVLDNMFWKDNQKQLFPFVQ